jgi:hypothetical protein
MKNLVVACLLSAICCACRKLRKRRRRGLSPLIDPSSPQLHPMQRERRRLRQLPHRRRSCRHPPAEDAPAEGAPAQPGPAGDPRHVHRAGARSPALPAELHQHEAGGVHGHRLRERQDEFRDGPDDDALLHAADQGGHGVFFQRDHHGAAAVRKRNRVDCFWWVARNHRLGRCAHGTFFQTG